MLIDLPRENRTKFKRKASLEFLYTFSYEREIDLYTYL